MTDDPDPLTVEYMVSGVRMPGATRREKREAVRILIQRGGTAGQIAAWVGCSTRTVERLRALIRKGEV